MTDVNALNERTRVLKNLREGIEELKKQSFLATGDPRYDFAYNEVLTLIDRYGQVPAEAGD
jgi:hypothetical protein